VETNEPTCPNCGGTLYVRGLFYLEKIPLTVEGYAPTDGDVGAADDSLEVYCVACDYSEDMQTYAEEKEK
jgi:hypothetical protein